MLKTIAFLALSIILSAVVAQNVSPRPTGSNRISSGSGSGDSLVPTFGPLAPRDGGEPQEDGNWVFSSSRGSGGNAGGDGATAPLFAGWPNIILPLNETTGTVAHDISGSGNNGMINRATDAGQNYWTQDGFSSRFQSVNTYIQLPAAVNTDLSWCLAIYTGYRTSSNFDQQMYMSDVGFTGFYATALFGYQAQVYEDITDLADNNGNLIQANFPAETGFHVKCVVYGQSANGTRDRIYTDGVLDGFAGANGDATNGNSGASGNWYLGAWSSGPSLMTYYYVVGWAGQESDDSIRQDTQMLRAAAAAKGAALFPPAAPATHPLVIAEGDSITNGGGAATTSWWPSLLTLNPAYTGGGGSQAVTGAVNFGIPGFSALGIMEQGRWRDTPYCVTSIEKSMAVIFAGTNDALFGFYPPEQVYGFLTGYAKILTQAGCQVGIGTMLSRTGLDTYKDQLNPLIRSGAAANGYFIVDFAASPDLGADNANANATFFNSDKTHPTNEGQAILAQEASDAIAAYGLGAASYAAPTAYANSATLTSADRYVRALPTASTTYTLPECLGITGATYAITNASEGANTITFAGQSGELITGRTTAAQNVVATFAARLISDASGGCGWTRVQ